MWYSAFPSDVHESTKQSRMRQRLTVYTFSLFLFSLFHTSFLFMTETYFSTPTSHIPGEQVPSQSSNASDSIVFESTMEEIPHRISTPFRTASEIDVDEPLEESDFRVYEGEYNTCSRKSTY